jgi:hypothetical protein
MHVYIQTSFNKELAKNNDLQTHQSNMKCVLVECVWIKNLVGTITYLKRQDCSNEQYTINSGISI